jgi:GNAT superfamily N-acetyltransferase
VAPDPGRRIAHPTVIRPAPAPLSAILVRAAEPSDRAAVLGFTRDTFDWGDYIADAWDDWLADPAGQLLVAEVDGQVTAAAHVALVSTGEAWLEGMRVHPAFRRLGLARQLHLECRRWARRRGATVARLATEMANDPARRQVEALGMRFTARFLSAESGASPSHPPGVRLGHRGDRPTLDRVWARPALRWRAAGLFPVGWRWRAITEDDVAARFASRRAVVGHTGFALLRTTEDGVLVDWLDGPPRAWVPLLEGTRWAADGLRPGQAVHMVVPGGPDVSAAAQAAGFTVGFDFALYEVRLADPL